MIEIATLASSALAAALPFLKDIATDAADSLKSGTSEYLKKKIAELFLKNANPVVQERAKDVVNSPTAENQQTLKVHLEEQLKNDSNFKAELENLMKELHNSDQQTINQQINGPVGTSINANEINGGFTVN